MAFGGSSRGGGQYSEAANKYKEVFGDKVHVYCMVIPTAAEFYCPDNALSCTRPQRPTINHIYSQLSPKVKAVDIYTPLGQHAKKTYICVLTIIGHLLEPITPLRNSLRSLAYLSSPSQVMSVRSCMDM